MTGLVDMLHSKDMVLLQAVFSALSIDLSMFAGPFTLVIASLYLTNKLTDATITLGLFGPVWLYLALFRSVWCCLEGGI